MNIVKKLLVTFVIFGCAVVTVGAFALYALKGANTRFEYVMDNSLPSVQVLDQILQARESARRNIYMALISAEKAETAKYVAATRSDLQNVGKLLNDYQGRYISDATDAQLTRENIKLLAAYQAIVNQLLARYEQQGLDAVRPLLAENGEVAENSRLFSGRLQQQIDYNYQIAEKFNQQNQRSFTHTLLLLIAIIVVSGALAGALALTVLRYISASLSHFQSRMQLINDSMDLRIRVELDKNDEIGLTARAFNALIGRMQEILQTIQMASTQVDVASAEIAASNEDLSSRTEQQAAALEETAASMNQLAVTVGHNVDNAKSADSLMGDAESIFRQGDAELKKLQQSMQAISLSSNRIAEITSIIDSIAFQTNILALNAAVEAARAGENGRGFAVVAGEVRTLSQRSAGAAKDIKRLIDEALGNISTGVKFAEGVSGKMAQALDAVTGTSQIIGQVSHSSTEQSFGIDQVNVAVGQMETVLQQNAAMVQQMSSAAFSLSEQANKLLGSVSVFKIEKAATA